MEKGSIYIQKAQMAQKAGGYHRSHNWKHPKNYWDWDVLKKGGVCVCAYSTAEDKQQHSWIVSHDRDRSVSVSRMLWVLAPCMPIFTFIQIHHIPIQLVIYLIYVFLMIFCVSLSTVSVTVVLLGASSTLDHQKRPPKARPKHQKIPSFTAFLSFVLFLCWL